MGLSLFVIAVNTQSQNQTDTTSTESEELPDYAVLHRVEPIYPTRAASRGMEGFVVIEFDIAPTGRVINPKIIESQPKGLFDRSGLRAVAQWYYLPAHVDGKAIESHGVRTKLSYRLGRSTKIDTLNAEEQRSLREQGAQSIEEGLQLLRFQIARGNIVDAKILLMDYLERDDFGGFNARSSLITETPFHKISDKISPQDFERLELKAEQSQQGDRFALLAQLYKATKNWPAAQLALSKAFAAGNLSEPSTVKLTLVGMLFNTQQYDAALKVVETLLVEDSQSEKLNKWHDAIELERHRQSLITDHLVSSAVN